MHRYCIRVDGQMFVQHAFKFYLVKQNKISYSYCILYENYLLLAEGFSIKHPFNQ